METTKPPPDFDCIAMKRELQARIHEQVKDMTTEERVAFYNTPTNQPLFQRLREKQ